MKKIIILIFLAFTLYSGYNFLSSQTGQETIQTAKITKLSYDVVNETDPAKILKIVEENEDLVQEMIKDEVITAEQYDQFKEVVTELDSTGQEVDKKTLAEVYLKDMVTPDSFEEMLTILDKDKLELSDMNEIRQLLQ